jgi:hypothetical protein
LVLPQPDHALQLFDAEFHGPSSQIERHGQVSSGVRQIGHEQLGVSGALVMPPATQHNCDISDWRCQLICTDAIPGRRRSGLTSSFPQAAMARVVISCQL